MWRDGVAGGRRAPARDIDRCLVLRQLRRDVRSLGTGTRSTSAHPLKKSRETVDMTKTMSTHAPEPHVDSRNIELRRPHASASRSEAGSEAVRLRLMDGAARAVGTVCSPELTRLLNLARRNTAIGRVHGHLVVVHEVDAFDEVCSETHRGIAVKTRWNETDVEHTDFAIVGPLGTLRPECRPDCTAIREVGSVEYYQTAEIEEFFSCNAHLKADS